jgi:Na+-transporting NADH:ubiquinone oxidoreductase subunit B
MTETQKRKKLTQKQPLMRRMIIALLPCIVASVYFYGWRSLAVIIVSCIVGYLVEYIFLKKFNEPVSEAVFVSAIIYALILPPTIAWHILFIGIVFAIMFGKMVFGGFGRNIFNPAMTGRAFLYICFPVALTATWAPPAQGTWGALGMWTTAVPDMITAATPMALVKTGQAAPQLVDLFFGRLAGSMGTTSVLAILLGGFYVFFTKTANRWIILMMIGVYALFNLGAPWLHIPGTAGMLTALMGGGFLFGAFFMATDPISAPKFLPSQLIYAALIAISTFVIRTFSVFNGGLMFAILFANMFAPILDFYFKQRKKRYEKSDVSQNAEVPA